MNCDLLLVCMYNLYIYNFYVNANSTSVTRGEV